MNEKVSSVWVQRAMKRPALIRTGGKAVSSPGVLVRLHADVSAILCTAGCTAGTAGTAAMKAFPAGSAAGEHHLAGAPRVAPARIA
jgi:hypothetical protein